jgi:hypothetical protein
MAVEGTCSTEEVRGKTNWLEMDWRRRSPMRGGCDGGGSKSVAPDDGFLAVRWTNGKGEGAEAAARLDPGASSVDEGAKWRSAQWFPCAKTKGEMGVRSTAPGGGRREGGDPTVWVRRVEKGGGVQATGKTRDQWGRSTVNTTREQGGGV